MMKNFLWGIPLLLSLASCAQQDPVGPAQAVPVRVEVPIQSESMEQDTRATDENTICNVNYYMVSPVYKEILHGYQTTASLRFECAPGEYDLYVLANVHEDLGPKTVAELQSLKLDYNTQYKNLPMWSKSSVTIPAQNKNTLYRLPAVRVKRGLAKVIVNLQSLDNHIVAKSIRMVNLPCVSKPFDDGSMPSANSIDYMKGPQTSLTEPYAPFSAVYYLPENLQGERSYILTQEQKGADNAPEFATYLLIRAEYENKALAYRIYLGSNNTTNFDLKRNTCYTMNILIHGVNQVDTRIASYEVNMWTDYLKDACGTYFLPGSMRSMNIDIVGENSSRMRGRLLLESGAATNFSFNGQSGLDDYPFMIQNIRGKNSFPIQYAPFLVTRSNSLLQYTVMVEDDGGIQISNFLQQHFANAVQVYRSTQSGVIIATEALSSQTLEGGAFMAMCYDDGCTLHAASDAGAIFEGWYADNTYQRLLSTAASIKYIPSGNKGVLFAKFSTVTPLDTSGTANCYIAPKRNAYYSFDATVKGNNKAAGDMEPGSLSGTKVKKIWETGSLAGGVISEVRYRDGRIVFRTGATEGNALIGLFNDEGKCIWSWHVWATDFDPIRTQMAYQGGSAFMERNLGALSSDHSHFTARGLYYQWGRKDPFLYPASISSRTPAPTVYQNGFRFERYKNSATIAYAIEHPTTYIESGSDWQFNLIALINLWGNTSSTSALTDTGTKSFFDPCPPGWRVPDRRTWEKAEIKIKSVDWGLCFVCDAGNSAYPYYPMSGFYNGNDYPNCGSWGYTWTNAPTKDGAAALLLQPGGTFPSSNEKRDYGIPVRCMRE